MKVIHDPAIFEKEKGHCWVNNSTLQGYGSGYPAVAELCRLSVHNETFSSCHVGHILRNTIYDKYYQRRTKQLGMLSIFYIKTGEMYFRSNEQTILAEAGDCVLLKPHSKNDFLYLPGHQPCSNYELALTGTMLDDMIRLFGFENIFGFRLDADDFFEDIFNRMNELKKQKSRRPKLHLLAGIAIETLHFIAGAARNQKIQQAAASICELLEQQMEKKTSMLDIARQIGIPLAEMNRQFRMAFGVTPYNYLKKFRLQRGAELLRNGVSVKETASQIAYNSPKSFSAEFHRFYGVSPRQYRHLSDENTSLIHPDTN